VWTVISGQSNITVKLSTWLFKEIKDQRETIDLHRTQIQKPHGDNKCPIAILQ
jgi:hypothetical protein